MAGRTVWNVNSTAVGGGVAEMLQALVGYVRDLDIPVRWMVIGGDPGAVTFRHGHRREVLAHIRDHYLGDLHLLHYARGCSRR